MSSVPGSASTHSSPSSSSHIRRARLRSVVTKVPLTSCVGLTCEAVAAAGLVATVMLGYSTRCSRLQIQYQRLARHGTRHADLNFALALLVGQHLVAMVGLAAQKPDAAGAAHPLGAQRLDLDAVGLEHGQDRAV